MHKTFLLLLVVALLSTSCLARGGISGEIRTNIDATLEALYTASVETLRVEKITIEEDKSDAMTALVKGRYADGTQVTIHCELLTQKATSITIQIGLFGNKTRSEALLKEIGLRLPKP